MPCDEEYVLDVRADGQLVAYHKEGSMVAQRCFPDGDLATETDKFEMREILDGVPQDQLDEFEYRWFVTGGFVDDRTVIATLDNRDHTTRSDWLLDSPPDPDDEAWRGLAPRRVEYRDVPDDADLSGHKVYGMGDGTWLTAAGDAIQQWTLA